MNKLEYVMSHNPSWKPYSIIHVGDTLYFNDDAMKELDIYSVGLGESIKLCDDIEGIVIRLFRPKRKWWKFWIKPKVSGCCFTVTSIKEK